MANKLTNLWYRAIALVDKGANPDAHVMLAKRDDVQKNEDQGYGSMEECMGALGDEAKCKALMAAMKRAEQGADMPDPKVTEDVAKAVAEVADLKKRLDETEAARKAAEVRLAKMEEDDAARAAIAKVETFKLPVETEKFAPLYRKAAAALSAEEVAEFDKALVGMAQQVATSKLLAEIGSGAVSVAGDTYAKIQAGAAQLIQKDGKLSPAQAEAKFLETPEGKRLYDQYEADRAEAARRVR